ncbi:hypothetical protein BTS2_3568 [Bacillus sp. TS-2]|nr:hypothetical protein BTS2_3568 [Bacillus sp. TS-2]
MQNKPKWALCILVLFFLFVLFIPITFAHAQEERLHIEVKSGFDGKINELKGFPLQLTVRNLGEDISGEIGIHISPSYSSNGYLLIPMDLLEGEEKSITVSVPGNQYYSSTGNAQQLFFFESGYENGRSVSFSGDKTIRGSYIGYEKTVVGLLSNDPDTLNSVKNTKGSLELEFVNVDPNMIPDDFLGLTVLDYLLVDQFALTELTEPQMNALTNWVKFGGTIIFGGEPGVAQKAGSFRDLLPMSSMITTINVAAQNFESIDEFENIEFPAATFPLYIGELNDGASTVLDLKNEEVLVASNKYGTGTISQLSFSPSSSIFNDWEGHPILWEKIINLTQQYQEFSYMYDEMDNLRTVNDLFDSAIIPFGWMLLIFSLYILVIFPLLFFLLKRFDKREHAWWIIPSISIIVSVGLFLYGGKDRLVDPQMNELSVVKLESNGEQHGIGSYSFLSNKGGDYELIVPNQHFSAIPFNDLFINGNDVAPNVGVYKQSGLQKVLFKDVEYWSVRNVTGPLYNQSDMSLSYELSMTDQKVTGTITNETGKEIESLLLLTGQEEIELGSWSVDESKDVSFDVNSSLLLSPMYSYNWNYSNDIDEQKFNQAKETAHNFNLFDPQSPSLVAITKDSLYEDVTLNGQSNLTKAYNMMIQPIKIQVDMGETFEFKSTDLLPHVYMLEGDGYLDTFPIYESQPEFYAGAGRYSIDYYVPVDTIHVNAIQEFEFTMLPPQVETEIYNFTENQYEIVDNGLLLNNPADYINETGMLKIAITKAEAPDRVTLPQITFKGVVEND